MTLKYVLIIGDAREALPKIPDNSVDFIVTSPPYWTLEVFSAPDEPGADKDLSRIRNMEEFFRELGKVWRECARVLRPGRVLVCEFEDYACAGKDYFGCARELCLVGPMVDSIERAGLQLISRWIWYKSPPGVAKRKFMYTLYGNLKDKGFWPRAVANWAYVFAFKKAGAQRRPWPLDFDPNDWKHWVDGVWTDIPSESGWGNDITGGATFSVKLIERLIRIFTAPGELVLDPFLGTGTTMLAAFNTGRACIGIEVLPRMEAVIRRRVGWGRQRFDVPVEWEIIRM